MLTNTFGLKMKNLDKAAATTEEYPWMGLKYNELFYNMRTSPASCPNSSWQLRFIGICSRLGGLRRRKGEQK